MRRSARRLALAIALAAIGPARPLAAQQSWLDLNRAADSALAARDYPAYYRLISRLHDMAPGHPRITWAMARAEALRGERDAAFRWLARYAGMGLERDLAADSGFASLRADARFASIAARLQRNARPVRHSEKAFVLPDADLVAEDLAYDPARRRFFVSSVHKRKILVREPDGHIRDFVSAGRDGVWGMLSLAADPARRRLWATTASLPQAEGWSAADSNRTAVLLYDLDDGRLLERIEPPRDGSPHVLGDMALLPDGAVLIADEQSGELVRARAGGGRLETVVPRGTFISPQQPAPAADGRSGLVPGYVKGIGSVELATGRVAWLAAAETVAIAGIDGLVRWRGELVACQNGVRPNRVVRLRLDPAGSRIEGWSLIETGAPALNEPTHGVLLGDVFYYIANSGWDRLNDEGAILPGAAAVIRRARLRR